MKFMDTVNELQAVVKKLITEMQKDYAGAAGECICISGVADPDCPVHGLPKVTPDLPLNVKVAKALGYIVWNAGSPGWWMSKEGYGNYVPDYPNDLVAAMGALEEYVGKNRNYSICYYPDFEGRFRVSIWDLTFKREFHSDARGNDLPQAICEAICKHSEAR